MFRLFTYGTLQNKEVQLELFGRVLEGERDLLRGFRIKQIVFESDNSEGVKQVYPAAVPSGNSHDALAGKVYRLTGSELELADQYETAVYSRMKVELASGNTAWIYVLSPSTNI